MAGSIRLCHLSDPHVGGHRGALAVFDFLVGDAIERGADHVLVTGDLVHRPRREDLQALIAVLKRHDLWHPARCTLLPGNHDVSGLPDDSHHGRSPASRRAALRAFAAATAHVNRPYPRRPGNGRGVRLFVGRPIHKRLGPLRLLALSTASLVHPVAGALEAADLSALRRAFGRPKQGVRAVAVHHHPYALPVGFDPGLGRYVPEGLEDGDALLAACKAGQVDLLLHGHLHTAGGRTDRRIGGVRVRCQGTARGETRDGRRRFGYDLWTVGTTGVRLRSYDFGSGQVVDGLLERQLPEAE